MKKSFFILSFFLLNLSLFSQENNLIKSKIISINDSRNTSLLNLYEFNLVKKNVYAISANSSHLHIKGGKPKYKLRNITRKDWKEIEKLIDTIDLTQYHQDNINFQNYWILIDNVKYQSDFQDEVNILDKIFEILNKKKSL